MASRAATQLPRSRALAFVLGLAFCLQPHAADLQVAPTSITLAARQKADGLWLSNTGDVPLHAQVRVYRWTQVEGEDRLEATGDIAVSPPMIQLPGGQRQLVRVIRLGAPPAEVETSYRLIVDELPAPAVPRPASAAPPAGADPRVGLEFVLRYSVPVFLLPGTAAAPQPQLLSRAIRHGAELQLEIRNTGSAHAQIAELVLVDRSGRRWNVRPGLAGYVLPGQHKRWPVPASVIGQAALPGVFKARVNGAFTDQDLLEQAIENPAR